MGNAKAAHAAGAKREREGLGKKGRFLSRRDRESRMQLITGLEREFLVNMAFAIVAGYLIGVERESRGKSAGISTHCFVIGGATLFTMLSAAIAPADPARIAAGIVTGVGFLGAGIIMKGEDGRITNLTTAANIWFSAALGVAIGSGWYLIAVLATAYAVLVPQLPHLTPLEHHHDK